MHKPNARALVVYTMLIPLVYVIYSLQPIGSAYGQSKAPASKASSSPAAGSSDLGIYLQTLTLDANREVWVGGSVWLIHSLLTRVIGSDVNARTMLGVNVIDDLLFTSGRSGWFIADNRYLYQTRDGGDTWQENLEAPVHLRSVYFSDPDNGWLAGSHGMISHTSDAGRTWREQITGTDHDLRKVVFVNRFHGWAIGGTFDRYMNSHSVLLTTNDGGKAWKSIQDAPSLRSISFADSSNGWGLTTDNNILHTTDGGQKWTIQHEGDDAHFSSMVFLNEQEGWAVGDEVIRTRDGGQTWVRINKTRLTDTLEQVLFVNSKTGWAIERRVTPRLVHTENGGETWKPIPEDWVGEVTRQLQGVLKNPRR